MPKTVGIPPTPLSKKVYRKMLRELQIGLVTLQRHLIAHDHRIVVVFEGRDASGKDGTIKRIVEHTSPRETRVVALGPPSERDRESWYFQRYVAHFPSAREMVLFNRSWYNRAGVERVMGFCSKAETEAFFGTVNEFESLLVRDGVTLLKYYLDISYEEQRRRLAERHKDPLKRWKVSPIDERALELFDAYSKARDTMLARTHTTASPWMIVRADDKRRTRLNVIADLLGRVPCPGRRRHLASPDRGIVDVYDPARHDEMLARGH